MNSRHRPSRAAIELVARFEGYRQHAARLPDGRWTLGYGHTRSAREGAQVSRDDAWALLTYDLMTVGDAIADLVFTPLTRNEFDALCAFAFGIGLENFRASGVLARLNEGAHLQAACAMELWRRAQFEGQSIVVDALIRRRAAEKALFLTPDDGTWTPVPAAVLPPDLDYDTLRLVPRDRPAALAATLDGARAQVARADDHGPAQAAAASVTARLRRFFHGEPERVEPAAPTAPADAAPLSIAPAQDDAVALTEPATAPVVEAPEPAAQAEPSEEAVPQAAPAPVASAEDQETNAARAPGLGALSVLAAAGVLLFVVSLGWYFSVSGAAGSHGFALVAVWIACLAGVAAFAVAVYLMLERLARAVGDLAEEADG